MNNGGCELYHLHDIYDGNIWREFQTVNGVPFLSKRYNYGIVINVDCLSSMNILPDPTESTSQYSTQARECNRPGTTEFHMINSYLWQLVKLLWKGVWCVAECLKQVVVRALCIFPLGERFVGFWVTQHTMDVQYAWNSFQEDLVMSMIINWPPRSKQSKCGRDSLFTRHVWKRPIIVQTWPQGFCIAKVALLWSPRLLAIDSMHNLYLKIWQKFGCLRD